MRRTFVIEPHDPVIFRDGRPFNAGSGARTVDFAPPSVIAGALRTRLGERSNFADIEKLLELNQTGPFLASSPWERHHWTPLFPAPADVVCHGHAWKPLRPRHEDAVLTDIPAGLAPLWGADGGKAEPAPAFWPSTVMDSWLQHAGSEAWSPDAAIWQVPSLARQRRLHVNIAVGQQTAEDGMLFATEGLEFTGASRQRLAILTQADTAYDHPIPGVSHVGGESRTALWHEVEANAVHWPTCPDLSKGPLLRLVLATPAAFDQGWRPAWTDTGHPPGTTGLELKLVAAAVPRAIPLSGWDLKKQAPKKTRFLAPAGSVYFFQVISGDPSQLWLQSVSDQLQDRRDGFGIVLCGVSSWHKS